MARITMALEWFTKVLKDYANWLFAWAREAGQNSLDAGATVITAEVTLNAEGNTVAKWTDDGKGMNRTILETKFMAVGGSQKEEGNAGGFGIAKLVLAFAHLCYSIRTGNLWVTGRNAEYEIVETRETVKGMTLTATMAGDVVIRLTEAIRNWVSHTTPNRRVLFYLNGQAVPFMGSLPAPVSVQDWCSVHTVEGMEAGIKVRINGQYMFNVYSEVETGVMVELTGSSLAYLTSNRDSLNWEYKDKLQKLVTVITRDPDVLFDTDSDVIEFHEGTLGPAATEESEANEQKEAPGVWHTTREEMAEASDEPQRCAARRDTERLNTTKLPDTVMLDTRLSNVHDFVIINKTNKPIPHKYTVAGMRPMEWRLLARWTRIVQACARVLGIRRTIRTGWIFSVTAQAAYKRNAQHGSLVLLNPCKLEGSAWVKAHDTSRDSFYNLVASAVHELTHITNSYHDESYACALTDNMALVFANLATINKAK
jgi:hypothetical protein